MEVLLGITHWSALGVGLFVAARMFRDLADLSQWFVRTSREATMRTFYNRHSLALVHLASSAVAVLTFALFDVGNLWALLAALAIGTLLLYTGYINPRLMMRSQQDSARYFPVDKARERLGPDTSLIVMEVDGVAFGHPDDEILRPHVASPPDSPDGGDVVMTYCGLTNMGIAYEPRIEGQRLDLGVMTQLENNLVMWDRTTGEPVQQFWGSRECTGPNGPRMPEWPSYRMPMWAFEKTFPDGKIFLNPIVPLVRNPVVAVYDNAMHRIFNRGIVMQAENEAPAFPTIGRFDDRLPNKEKVYGANVGDDHVAYTEQFIRAHGAPLNVTIGGQEIVVTYHDDVDSVGMYVNETGEPVRRIAFGGATDSGHLRRLPTMKAAAYWVVWQNFFPDTDVNRAPSSSTIHRDSVRWHRAAS